MKKFLLLLAITAITASAPAGARDNIFSRLRGSSQPTRSTSAKTSQQKADSIFESVRQRYTQGKISADSVVSLALYHKTWSPAVAERCLQLVATGGNPRSVMELGALYAFSPEFSSRAADGLKLLQAAAKAGANDANGYLGIYYFNRNDFTQAKRYLDAWHPMTYGFGNAAIGNMYLTGKGATQDLAKARENFRQAALKGYPRGMALYGTSLNKGEGGPVDYPDAFFWLYTAGDLGDDAARLMLFLPRRNQQQANTTDQNEKMLQVVELLQKTNQKHSMKDEPIYKDGFLVGLKAQEKAAEQGDDWARFYLGSLNYNGEFLNQNYSQAIRYYEPIAQHARLPRAVLALVNERLAQMYREGKGTAANPAKAASHLRVAAQQGSLPAYRLLEHIPD